jgi:hypothetical protein
VSDVPAQRQRALVIALLVSLVLWNLPFGGVLLYPFKLLATWLHEMSHGLVMLTTGAGFDRLEIFEDTSGMAYARFGVNNAGQAAIASAGYIGTAAFGALFLVCGQTQRGARAVLAALGAMLGLSALLWMANDFGLASAAIGAFAFLAIAAFASEPIAYYAVNFVAAQLCVNAVLDIRVLFRSQLVINGEVAGASDAHNMAQATFGSAWLWATVWLLWSLAVFYLALRLVHLRQSRSKSIGS